MTPGRPGNGGIRGPDRGVGSVDGRPADAARGSPPHPLIGALLPLANHGEFVVSLAVGFVVGLAAIYVGATQWRVRKRIQNTATERIRSVAAGRTAVAGTCRDVGLTHTEPYGDRDCVYRHWTVQEHRPLDDQATEEWVTVATGTDVAPFFVDDGTGRILVDTTEAPQFEISDANAVTIEVEAGDPAPPAVASFHDLSTATGVGHGPAEAGADDRPADGGPGEGARADAAARSRETVLQHHVDDTLLDEDGDIRPEVTAVQLQQELEDVPGVDASDLFGGTAGGTGSERSTDRGEGLDEPDADAIVAELGGTGEAGDHGTGSSVARRLIERGLGSVTGGRLGGGTGLVGTGRDVGSLDASGDRRFSQSVVPVGDPVYVYGAAHLRDAEAGTNGDRLKLGEDPATGEFAVSDHGEAAITSTSTTRGPLYVVVGLVLSTVCLAGLLSSFGVG